jgi:hypothetical protein
METKDTENWDYEWRKMIDSGGKLVPRKHSDDEPIWMREATNKIRREEKEKIEREEEEKIENMNWIQIMATQHLC